MQNIFLHFRTDFSQVRNGIFDFMNFWHFDSGVLISNFGVLWLRICGLLDLCIYLKYNTMVLDSHPSTLTCEAKYTQKAKKRYKPNKLVC